MTRTLTKPEDEIGYVVKFDTSFLGLNGICVVPIRAAQIFGDKVAAEDAVYQQAQVHEYFKNIYNKKQFTVKPVRISYIQA